MVIDRDRDAIAIHAAVLGDSSDDSVLIYVRTGQILQCHRGVDQHLLINCDLNGVCCNRVASDDNLVDWLSILFGLLGQRRTGSEQQQSCSISEVHSCTPE